MSRPSTLLVVLLNVSLNTLPVLALRVIYQALKKPYPKVREAGSPLHIPRTPACAGNKDSKETQGWGQGAETQGADTQCHQGGQIKGSRTPGGKRPS